MSTNEAAERLRGLLAAWSDDDPEEQRRTLADLDAALAHERSAGAAPLDVDVLARALLIVDDEYPGILNEIAIDDTAVFPAAAALHKALVYLLANGRWEARELRTPRLVEGTDR